MGGERILLLFQRGEEKRSRQSLDGRKRRRVGGIHVNKLLFDRGKGVGFGKTKDLKRNFSCTAFMRKKKLLSLRKGDHPIEEGGGKLKGQLLVSGGGVKKSA